MSTQVSTRPGLVPARRPAAPAVPRDRRVPQRAGTTGPPGASVGRHVYVRRRVGVLLALLCVAFLATGLIGRVGAGAELEERVAGHVVVEPGETLWDVAVATAPDGMDAREHLQDLRELNGLDGARVDAWTVVLLPAR